MAKFVWLTFLDIYFSQCTPVHPSGQNHWYSMVPLPFWQRPPFLHDFPSDLARSQAGWGTSHFSPSKPRVQLHANPFRCVIWHIPCSLHLCPHGWIWKILWAFFQHKISESNRRSTFLLILLLIICATHHSHLVFRSGFPSIRLGKHTRSREDPYHFGIDHRAGRHSPQFWLGHMHSVVSHSFHLRSRVRIHSKNQCEIVPSSYRSRGLYICHCKAEMLQNVCI